MRGEGRFWGGCVRSDGLSFFLAWDLSSHSVFTGYLSWLLAF